MQTLILSSYRLFPLGLWAYSIPEIGPCWAFSYRELPNNGEAASVTLEGEEREREEITSGKVRFPISSFSPSFYKLL